MEEIMPEKQTERTLIMTCAEYESGEGLVSTAVIVETAEEKAYAMLAAGLLAVLELDSTTVADFNELAEVVSNLWNRHCYWDNEGLMRHQLMHLAELQAEGRLRR
jgi:hypothetical protein